MRTIMGVAVLGLLLVLPGALSAQEAREHQNLQVLPQDISRDALGDVMLGFLRGLGLPRRAGAGCLHCHEGSLEVPRSEWNWASDAKPTKRTARRMIAMVNAINGDHLGNLETRNAPSFEVSCATCHVGRVDPRPIMDVLSGAYEAAGADSVASTYRALHGRYYGSAAYDLRVSVLANMARGLAEAGAYDQALQISAVNEQTHRDEPSARSVTLALQIQQVLDGEGPDDAIELFNRMFETEMPAALTYSILDGIGWRTFRLDRRQEGLALIRANRDAFPQNYFTFESLNEALHADGKMSRAEIIRRYEEFLRENPGHRNARAQLTNHRRRLP